jgi:hypothetical protein
VRPHFFLKQSGERAASLERVMPRRPRSASTRGEAGRSSNLLMPSSPPALPESDGAEQNLRGSGGRGAAEEAGVGLGTAGASECGLDSAPRESEQRPARGARVERGNLMLAEVTVRRSARQPRGLARADRPDCAEGAAAPLASGGALAPAARAASGGDDRGSRASPHPRYAESMVSVESRRRISEPCVFSSSGGMIQHRPQQPPTSARS